jgi:hypothetical protein
MPEARAAATPGAGQVGDWNKRRLTLIEKKYAGGVTAEEEAELAALQAKMDEHLDAVAPVPLEQLEAFEEEVRKVYPDYGRAGGKTPGAP